ncbi:MAG: hypothetical protein AAF089_12775, partial [Bacteroidota bacterium]
MPYPSVDALQNMLAEEVFGHTKHSKKAAGRALGTLVEVITYYTLTSWGFRNAIAIERGLPEYANDIISHNVEYTLHPIVEHIDLVVQNPRLPLSSAKILKALDGKISWANRDNRKSSNQLLSSKGILRNSCTIADDGDLFATAHLNEVRDDLADIDIYALYHHPYMMVECKRVGVEEGAKKGPQTIEKAKQGAYVARTVSSLQKLRLPDGRAGGVIVAEDGSHSIGEFRDLLETVVESDGSDVLSRFTLSVGVVSNHGNWFTAELKNKEMEVLAGSYDWLLFLTDEGMMEFLNDLILNPPEEYAAVKEAFGESHKKNKDQTRFTKVQMDYDADLALQSYFAANVDKVEGWFNIIGPAGFELDHLREQVTKLWNKDWNSIHKLA